MRGMDDTFNDNRYELIGKYKQRLIESTNIETSEDEMKVLDNILFRMWQIGWMDRMEKQAREEMDSCTLTIDLTEEQVEAWKKIVCGDEVTYSAMELARKTIEERLPEYKESYKKVYKKGAIGAIREIGRRMWHEAFEVDHDKDGMQKWDSGCWIRYKLFEKVATDCLEEFEK